MKFYFQCPNCGSDEEFVTPTEDPLSRSFLPSQVIIWQDRGRVLCTNCAYIFRRPPLSGTPLAKFAKWVVVLLVLPLIFAAILQANFKPAEVLPTNPVIATVEEFVVAQPRLVAWLLVAPFILLIVPCCAVAWLSNRSFRKQFSRQYRIHPLSSQELARQNRTRKESSPNPKATPSDATARTD